MKAIRPGLSVGSAVAVRAEAKARRHRLRGPRRPPEDDAEDGRQRPPAAGEDQGRVVSLRLCRHHGDCAQRGRRAPDQEHGQPQQVDEQHQPPAASETPAVGSASALQHPEELLRAADDRVRLAGELRRRLGGADADADRGGQAARGDQRAQGAKRIEVGAVVAREQRPFNPLSGEQPLDGRPLVDPGGRADLQHLAPPVRLETGLPAAAAISPACRSAASSSATPRQWSAWIGPLSSRRSPAASSEAPSSSPTKSRAVRAPSVGAGSTIASSARGASSSRPWLPA